MTGLPKELRWAAATSLSRSTGGGQRLPTSSKLSMTAILVIFSMFSCAQASEEGPILTERSEFRVLMDIPPDSIVPVEPGYFRPPVDIPVGLGGTFGELRPNHFHAGIDVRTNARVGLTLRSCADGYVSRVKVSPFGYGNALYIDHPNGYTTVYAHMKEFAEPIASFVKDIQYEQETFEVDIYPEPGQFQVKKGEQIGLSGNSGRSTSPHLHFEIRETESEWPVNPLFLTNWVKDDIPPVIQKLWVYSAEQARTYQRGKSYTVSGSNGKYRLRDTLELDFSEAVFGLEAVDRHNGNSGNNDINVLELWVNGERAFEYNLKKFSFDNTRYMNAHVDYPERQAARKWIHRCYRAPGNHLPAYVVDGAPLSLSSKASLVQLVVADGMDNESTLSFFVRRAGGGTSQAAAHVVEPALSEEQVVRGANAAAVFPEGCFYEPFVPRLREVRKAALSTTFAVGDRNMPVHKHYDLAIRLEAPANTPLDKVLIRRAGGSAYKSQLADGWVHARPRDFGTFYIDIDVTPPRITLNSSSRSSISLRVTDNLAGIADYDAYIDGEWVLPVYDGKKNLITHTFERSLSKGTHEFKLVVTDGVGNAAERVVAITR